MMKKILLILLTITTQLTMIGCQVVLENDTNMLVAVTDLEANHPTEFVKSKITIEANKNPEVHADLRVQVGPTKNNMSQSYHVQQIACSHTHMIPVKVTKIQNGTLNPAIFKIKKESIEPNN